jgi:WD40 repeat protein
MRRLKTAQHSPLKRTLLVTLSLAGLAGTQLRGSESERTQLDFYRDVYPFLKANCIACHNQSTSKAKLNMETPELMKKGGESGPGLIAGKAAESPIFLSAAHKGDGEIMPPKGNKQGAKDFSPIELAVLQTWIDQGAKPSVKPVRPITLHPIPAPLHPIYTVALTKDGRFAACGRANQVFIYDLATRQMVSRLSDESLAKNDGAPGETAAHKSMVQSVTFSPDGERMATGSFREVKIWRQEKGKNSTQKLNPEFVATLSVLGRDGKFMACADKAGAIRLVNPSSGAALKSIAGLEGTGLKALSLAPDSSKVAAINEAGVLGVWNFQDGKLLVRHEGLAGVAVLAWSFDGKAIITGGEDKIVRVWTLPEPDKTEFDAPKELRGATGAIVAITTGINPDRLLIAGRDGKVRLWSMTESRQVREFPIADVLSLGVSRDGKQFASGSADGFVRVWEIETGKKIAELRADIETNRQLAALESEQGSHGIELTFQTKALTRTEAQNKALEELLKKSHEAIAAATKALPERQKALETATKARETLQAAQATLSANPPAAAEGTPAKVDPALAKQIKEGQDKLAAAEKTENMAKAAAESSANHIKDAEAEIPRITQAKAKNEEAIVHLKAVVERAKAAQTKAGADLAALKATLAKTNRRPLHVIFSNDAQTVAAAFDDGNLDGWAVGSGVPMLRLAGSGKLTGASVAVLEDGSFMHATPAGAVSTLQTGSRWVLERVLAAGKEGVSFADRINAVRFSPDGKSLAVAGGEPSRSGDISLFEVVSGKLLKNWTGLHNDAVLSLDFSPDGTRLASGGADRLAKITEIATGKQTAVLEGHTHHVLGVSFRVDGRVLASSGGDGIVLVWDVLAGERLKKIQGWSKEVTSIQFIGATNQLLTSAGDNLVKIVNEEGGEVRAIPNLPDFMQAAASSPNSTVIIGGGEDSVLRVWDGTNGKVLATFDSK